MTNWLYVLIIFCSFIKKLFRCMPVRKGTCPHNPEHIYHTICGHFSWPAVTRISSHQLGWRLHEGDDFHPQENIDKMANGEPLTDQVGTGGCYWRCFSSLHRMSVISRTIFFLSCKLQWWQHRQNSTSVTQRLRLSRWEKQQAQISLIRAKAPMFSWWIYCRLLQPVSLLIFADCKT